MAHEYILITPLKNEENSLEELITSVTGQLVKPILWLIVDDGSTDRSPELIQKASDEHSWIKTIRLKEAPRDVNIHYSEVCVIGFKKAFEMAMKLNLGYEYIALLDADMSLPPNYYSTLITRMQNNSNIGIASGAIWSKIGGTYIEEKRWHDFPSGGARIWTKKCFDETGGYEIKIGADSISTARAKMKGWKTENISDVKANQSRPVYSAEGLWKGYKKNGESDYYMGCHPLTILGKSFMLIIKRNIVPGFAYAWGYVHAGIMRIPRLDDKELLKYFRTKSIKTFLRGNE